jgi:DNA-directed RNA polymerase subunit RPC12/RpoP
MSRLTDRISYLQGLAEGMKLNPEKDSHKLILGILDVLGEVGESFEALAESHGELSDYVEAIDEDLADLEANLYDDENENLARKEDDDDFEGMIEYECPHCGAKIEIDPDEVDFDEDALCPGCGKELFPELPEEGLDGKPEPEKEPDGKPEPEEEKQPEK